jgi:hypothetical protein
MMGAWAGPRERGLELVRIVRRRATAMPEEPQEVAANEWGTITYYPQWRTLELRWGPQTRSMGDDGFRQTLQLLADEGLKTRPRFMIVDSTEFFHTLGEGTLPWRDEHIVPLYNDAGVEKFAFLATASVPGTVEKGGTPAPDGPATFPTGWFETRDGMHAWLMS